MRTIDEYATKVIFRNKLSIKRQIFVSNIWWKIKHWFNFFQKKRIDEAVHNVLQLWSPGRQGQNPGQWNPESRVISSLKVIVLFDEAVYTHQLHGITRNGEKYNDTAAKCVTIK